MASQCERGDLAALGLIHFQRVAHFCVASCVGYVLGVRTLVVLFRELEWLSPVVRPTVTYVRPHLKLAHLRWLCNEAWEETLYHVLLALTLSTKVAFALLALLRLQRGLPVLFF